MSKKFITTGFIAIILFFSTAFCYATEENTSNSQNMDLGNEITESMNKVEKSASDLTNNVRNSNMVKGVEGAITDNNEVRTDNNEIRTDYNATRTALDTDFNNGTTMTETTWIWVILGVVGIVILATVWFYAMQNSGND